MQPHAISGQTQLSAINEDDRGSDKQKHEAVQQNNSQCNAIKMTDHGLSSMNHCFLFALQEPVYTSKLARIKKDVQNAKGCPRSQLIKRNKRPALDQEKQMDHTNAVTISKSPEE
jgi:hypothetical protein